MLKKSFQLRYQLEQLVDAFIAAGAFALAIPVRKALTVWRPDIFPDIGDGSHLSWLYLLLIPLWIFVFDFTDYYRRKSVRTSTTTLGALTRANVIGIMLAFFALYVLKIKDIPRALIFVYGSLDILLMWAKEILIVRFELVWSARPNVLFVGRPEDFKELTLRIKELTQWKPNMIGLFVPASTMPEIDEAHIQEDMARTLPDIKYLGTGDDLVHTLHEHSIDCVVLNPSQEHFEEIQKTINLCETEGVETWLIADFFRTSIARPQIDEFHEMPMLIFRTTPSISWALIVKRSMDLALSLLLGLVLAPVMLLIAIIIKASSPGPIIFRQERCTLHGRPFWMYKFRTMVADAETQRDALTENNEMSGPVFKMADDPRVTYFGRFLRRYSLDELPQLWNVLKGDMSLVGPRPPIPSEVAKYENWQRRRLSMRAGMTCIWQTAGRNKLGFDEWLKLDLQYIDTWSLMLDLKIILKTPFVVLRGTGV